MRNLLTASVGIVVLFVGAAAFQSPADARPGGGVHRGGGGGHVGTVNRNFSANRSINRNANVNRNINRSANVNRNVDVNRNRNVNVNRNVKYVYRNGQRGYWRNGIWIAAPVAAGAAYGYGGTSCSYFYNQWQKTNSIYWRDRYNQCVNGP
jgi:hypothetical protein